MDVVSLYLSCQDASANIQHDLFGSICDLTWPRPDFICWPSRSVIMNALRSALRRGTTWCPNYVASSLCSKVIRKKKNTFPQNRYFDICWPFAPQPLMSANFDGKSAKEQFNSYRVLFPRPLIYNGFGDNDTFPKKYENWLNLTFTHLQWPQHWP